MKFYHFQVALVQFTATTLGLCLALVKRKQFFLWAGRELCRFESESRYNLKKIQVFFEVLKTQGEAVSGTKLKCEPRI
jgi:hypothetical protein